MRILNGHNYTSSSAWNARDSALIGISVASDWWKEGREVFKPIVPRRKERPMKSQNAFITQWEISLSTIKLLCLILVDAISCWINSALSWFLCSWTIKILPIFSNIMEFWKRSPLKWTNNHSDVKDNARPLSYTILNLQWLIFTRQF